MVEATTIDLPWPMIGVIPITSARHVIAINLRDSMTVGPLWLMFADMNLFGSLAWAVVLAVTFDHPFFTVGAAKSSICGWTREVGFGSKPESLVNARMSAFASSGQAVA